MNVDERRALLLEQARRLLVVEAENVPELAPVFLPLDSHRLALRREIVVVLGGRGAGKSALFRVLGELASADKIRAFFGADVPEATWLDAFSESQNHPQVAALDAFAGRASDVALRAFWMSHLVRRIAAQYPGLVPQCPAFFAAEWSVDAAEAHIAEAAALLDAIEQALAAADMTLFASFDHLDRLGQFDPDVRQRYVKTLLALWLSLANRYRHLRAKIFLREDLFEAAQAAFADGSKLRGRSVAIEWDVASLYRLLVRYLAHGSDEMRLWLDGVPGLELQAWNQGFGLMPPEMDEVRQKALAERLAGKLMGIGIKKGYTYRWIPNRLQDGRGRIVPRSMLNLVGHACDLARADPLRRGKRLLDPEDLRAALEPTSRARSSEVAEEYPLVKRLEHLRGEQVLLERKLVVARLSQPLPGDPPTVPPGDAIFDELVRLGVLIVRDDRHGLGRIDVPDLYRYGFGILRKGGVKSPV